MYAFHASLPDSRPPPVSFSPPNAPPISAPLVPIFTLAMPQSLPRAEQKCFRASRRRRENRRRQPLRHGVVHRDRFIQGIELDEVDERREDLFSDDRHRRRGERTRVGST